MRLTIVKASKQENGVWDTFLQQEFRMCWNRNHFSSPPQQLLGSVASRKRQVTDVLIADLGTFDVEYDFYVHFCASTTGYDYDFILTVYEPELATMIKLTYT